MLFNSDGGVVNNAIDVISHLRGREAGWPAISRNTNTYSFVGTPAGAGTALARWYGRTSAPPFDRLGVATPMCSCWDAGMQGY